MKNTTIHKEEERGRVISDEKDRSSTRLKLESCISPLSPKDHLSDGIVNIVSGKIVSTNVHNTLEISYNQLKDFETGFPDTFREPIKKKVKTLWLIQKSRKSHSNVKLPDETKTFGRLLMIMKEESIDMRDILHNFELTPTPLPLFKQDRSMRGNTTRYHYEEQFEG